MLTSAGRSSRMSEVDRLRRRVDDVDEPLVGAHLEVLAAVLVLVRRADDRHHVLLGGQRHRADDRRPCSRHRVDDLACRRVDDLVVVRLESDADLLSGHDWLTFLVAHRCSDVNGDLLHRQTQQAALDHAHRVLFKGLRSAPRGPDTGSVHFQRSDPRTTAQNVEPEEFATSGYCLQPGRVAPLLAR